MALWFGETATNFRRIFSYREAIDLTFSTMSSGALLASLFRADIAVSTDDGLSKSKFPNAELPSDNDPRSSQKGEESSLVVSGEHAKLPKNTRYRKTAAAVLFMVHWAEIAVSLSSVIAVAGPSGCLKIALPATNTFAPALVA